MDVNFSNVLEGTRQYFQGLPKASPNSAQSQNESSTAAAVRPFWSEGPSGPSAALPAQPTHYRSEEGSLAQSGSPTMADSRPPSVAAVRQAPDAARPSPAPPPAPAPSSLPFRPPSEPLLEPEAHIIHKATVMQQAQAQAQAQQKQQSYLNPSRDLERPPSINMISPPTHIIHKPQRAPPELVHRAETERQDRRTPKEEPRIPPHFAVTEGGRYPPESVAPRDPSPVHPNKYYSHLPTAPAASYQNRAQNNTSQQRTLTVLQARQPRSGALSYPSGAYPKETMASGNGKIPQKSPYVSSTQASESYPRHQYETVTVSGSSPADTRQSPSVSDLYLKSSPMTPMPAQPSQKANRSAPVQYMRPHSYHPPQSHPDRQPPPEREKSVSSLSSVRHYPQTVPYQKSRAVPVSKPSGAQPAQQGQPGQHTYSQRAATQQIHNSSYHPTREPAMYATQQNHPRVSDPSISDGSPSRLSGSAPSHDYNYSRRIPPKSVPNHHSPGPTSNYHERIPSLTNDQRHPSMTPLSSQTHSGRSASHLNMMGESSHLYSRVPPTSSQHLTLKREYHPSPPLKPQLTAGGHQYSSGSVPHQHYPPVNPADRSAASGPSGSTSTGSSGYQTQPPYRPSSAAKHSYSTSPKHSIPPRTLPPKQNLTAHQPRPTVSVTSLVSQMNVMRQQSSRSEPTGGNPPKHRKESPLDLSVKTVRIPADSTAQDDTENMAYEKRDVVLHHGNVVNASTARDPSALPPNMINQRQRYPPECDPANSHKVDFLPNFNTQHPDKSLQRQYRETSQPYLQNTAPVRYERGYPDGHSAVPPSAYTNRAPPHPEMQQGYGNRYESAPKQTYAASSDYSRRHEQSLPKIDLTINLDDYERDNRRSAQAAYQKEDSRKREAGRVSNSIPHKSSRYDSWNAERHGRLDAVHPRELNSSAAPVHYKSINGTEVPSADRRRAYENHVYTKKSENVEPPLPTKYYQGLIQQSQSQPDLFYQKASNFQNSYDYNPPEKLPSLPVKQELHAMQHTTPADKRVLSILRNSLEARNFADNQKANDSSDDCIVVPSDNSPVPSADFSEYQSKKTKHMIEHRSSMASLSHETTSNPVSYKVQVPRAVDSIKYDSDSSLKSIRIREDLQSKPVPVIKETNEIPTSVIEPPNESSSPTDMDIAAVLAARIRTKAELKGFTQSSNNACPAKLAASENHIEEKESTLAPTNVSKVIPSIVHRRRLFSKTESDTNETKKDIPAIRSSSDSCIFDFQDSGSESEKPVSEKVPVEIVSKENQSDVANVDKTLLQVKSEEKTGMDDDPLWAEACDSFLEQLKTGKMKKARRRNVSIANREKSEIPVKDDLIDSIKIEKSVIANVVNVVTSDRVNPFMKKIKEEVKEVDPDNFPSDSSDEDQPLINRKVKKEKEDKLKNTLQVPNDIDSNWKSAVIKIENIMDTSEITKKCSKSNCLVSESKNQTDKSSSDDEQPIVKKRKQDVKNDLSNSDSSDTDSDELIVATRSKTRKSLKSGDGKSAKSPTKDSLKVHKDDNSKLKKQVFGDGSDFRPGWEEEVYKFKQSLRMPTRLINVTRPPHWPRVSTSLPDLDPYPNSPAPSTSTEELYTKKYAINMFDGHDKKHDLDSDSESMSSFSIHHKHNYDSEASCSTVISTTDKKTKNKAKHDTNSSIIDLLIQKCGKKDIRKKKSKDDSNIPKMIPKSTNPSELLATPSLSLERDCLKKGIRGVIREKVTEERSYLGSFRKQTISTFRAAFISNTDGALGATEEFSPIVLKSRTRTETRVLKQRATIKEVFGDERPASAPPVSCREEEPLPPPPPPPVVEIKTAEIKNKIILKKKMKKHCLSSAREGLRSSRLKRSDAKGRLLRIKKRNNYLKSLTSKKLKNSTSVIHKVKKEVGDSVPVIIDKDGDGVPVPVKKRFRKLFTRRKFSSGFDYIRKKKKLIKKEDGHKRKRGILVRPSPESVHDIQREIKNWIINKSVGETVLHRAARLGFTDCVAYCLEKLDVPPSCRDNAGYTALHEACSRGHLDIAKLLLQYGANVSEAAQGGIRPLHEACENGYIEIIRLLLSYGADPLLATYSGQTPISLSSGKAARLLQLHLNDVQGNVPQPWYFNGPCKLLDPVDSGYDAVAHPPTASLSPIPPNQIEMISASTPLPPLYRLKPAPHSSTSNSDSERSGSCSDSGLWCLLQDLASLLQVKSRDALLKQIHCGPGPPRDSLKELRMQEFLDRAQCQQLMSAGEKINIRASKIALVRYTDKVKQLLNTESVVVR